MGWELGYDSNWNREVGYGVPSKCDHPDCDKDIDRGLSYVCCKEEPYGGNDGCGLFFCGEHQNFNGQCEKCENGLDSFDPKPDTEEWIQHKMTHESWKWWREENGIK